MKRGINGICSQFCLAAPRRYCQFYGAGRVRLFSVGRGEHPWFPNLKSFRIFPRPGFLTPSLYRQHGPTGSHTWGLRSRLPNIAQPDSQCFFSSLAGFSKCCVCKSKYKLWGLEGLQLLACGPSGLLWALWAFLTSHGLIPSLAFWTYFAFPVYLLLLLLLFPFLSQDLSDTFHAVLNWYLDLLTFFFFQLCALFLLFAFTLFQSFEFSLSLSVWNYFYNSKKKPSSQYSSTFFNSWLVTTDCCSMRSPQLNS